jgi:hypothetical protein
MADPVVRDGSVVTPEGMYAADVAVEDGHISAVGTELSHSTARLVEMDMRVDQTGTMYGFLSH